MLDNILTGALKTLRTHFVAKGFDIRLVGGCVRDLMIGKTPSDIDLCTDADPNEQMEIYNEHGIRFIETGLQHGTITVVLDSVTYEITSLRTDVETDGRHATVEYTRDWLVDLERRDFTFNAMSMTFDGELIDPFNGLSDLKNGLVVFVGNADARIKEDYLRILRWFRFRGRYGTLANAEAKSAVINNASGLSNISRERIWTEIKKIISGPHGIKLMLEMHELGISKFINLPDYLSWRSYVEDVWNITKNPVTLLTAMYSDESVDILRAWKASNDEIYLANKLVWAYSGSTVVSPFKAMAVFRWPRDHAMELAAVITLDNFERNVLETIDIPTFPVTGNDLINIGLKPGPNFSVVLSNLKNKWAESNYAASKDELLSSVRV